MKMDSSFDVNAFLKQKHQNLPLSYDSAYLHGNNQVLDSGNQWHRDNSKSRKQSASRTKNSKNKRNIEPPPISETTIENWAQCESCKKWRRLPQFVDTEKLPETWVCALNVWDPFHQSCNDPEETVNEVKSPQNHQLELDLARPLPPPASSSLMQQLNFYHPLGTQGGRNYQKLEELHEQEYNSDILKLAVKAMNKDETEPTAPNPVDDRIVMYSDDTSSLLASELPHDVLLLDTAKRSQRKPRRREQSKKSVQENSTNNGENSDVDTSYSLDQNLKIVNRSRAFEEREEGEPKPEELNLEMGFGYNSTWPSLAKLSGNLSTICSISDTQRFQTKEQVDSPRVGLVSMFPQLSMQIPPIQFLPTIATEELVEANETFENATAKLGDVSNVEGFEQASAKLANLKSAFVDEDEPVEALGHEQVLDAISNFVSHTEAAKNYYELQKHRRHCSGPNMLLEAQLEQTFEEPLDQEPEESDGPDTLDSHHEVIDGGSNGWDERDGEYDVYPALDLTSGNSRMYMPKKEKTKKRHGRSKKLDPDKPKLQKLRENYAIANLGKSYFKKLRGMRPDVEYPAPDFKTLRMLAQGYKGGLEIPLDPCDINNSRESWLRYKNDQSADAHADSRSSEMFSSTSEIGEDLGYNYRRLSSREIDEDIHTVGKIILGLDNDAMLKLRQPIEYKSNSESSLLAPQAIAQLASTIPENLYTYDTHVLERLSCEIDLQDVNDS
ncbi:zinc finger protein [Babesia duncani]|uniref:Zinc finger protein n=1 Tax=Babesia duncani TaxID=323732 RepID=A0AAD9PHT7_9APIC|nr:zinc finger protein [Babesia duncani]KAK2197981.1 zinc finger protein [Babesia duncani]